MMQTRLPNGDLLLACSDAACAEMDPLAALDQLEKAFRLGNAVPTVRGPEKTRRALRVLARSHGGPYSCMDQTGSSRETATPSKIEGSTR